MPQDHHVKTRISPLWLSAGLPAAYRKLASPIELGAGNTAEVEKGWDTTDCCAVAVKRASGALAGWVEHEFNVLKQLRHPNIVHVLAGGTRPEATLAGRRLPQKSFLVMEHIDGDSADGGLGRAPRQVLLGIFCGLAHVHRSGFAHNDLNAENTNIMVAGDRAVLIDFEHAERHAGPLEEVAALCDNLSGIVAGEGTNLRRDFERFAGSNLVQAWRAGRPPLEEALRQQALFRPEGTRAETGVVAPPAAKRQRK